VTKVLIFIDWFLPGTKSGGPVRSVANIANQLDTIAFSIITRNIDYCSDKPYTSVEHHKWVSLNKNTEVFYIDDNKLSTQLLEKLILENKPDIIYINGIYSKYFSIIPLGLAKKHQIKHIIAARGMLSPHSIRVRPLKKKLFIAFMNLRKAYANATFHATNTDEDLHIKHLISNYNDIIVIPNLPRPIPKYIEDNLKKKAGNIRLIYLGRIAKEKGTLEAIDALSKCTGQIQLDMYGTIYDDTYWNSCKEKIKNLPHHIKVNYKGNLESEKVVNTIKNYHALLLFSGGENYGHAIVESFLASRPVIISKNTPWKNLEAKNMGYDINENQLPSSIQSMVNLDQNDFNKTCKSIRDQIEDLLDLKKIKEQYQNLFMK
jgi:glycosyltransferase involved in cell wall biosynthesis